MRRQKPVFVSLGNVGGGIQRSHQFVKLYPHVELVCIDITRMDGLPWKQVRADFRAGLEGFQDCTLAHVNSEFALGYYDENGLQRGFDATAEQVNAYTAAVLEIAHRKMRDRATISLMVDERLAPSVLQALADSPFRKGLVKQVFPGQGRLPDSCNMGIFFAGVAVRITARKLEDGSMASHNKI